METTCNNLIRCEWCGHLGPPVHVHGHTQCARCKTNIEPCCAGAPLQDQQEGDHEPDPARVDA